MGAPVALALDPDDPNFIVAVLADSENHADTWEGLWWSDDAGLSWNQVSYNPVTKTCATSACSATESQLFAGDDIVYDVAVHPSPDTANYFDRRVMLMTSHTSCGLLDIDIDTFTDTADPSDPGIQDPDWYSLNEYNCKFDTQTWGRIQASSLTVLERSATNDEVFYLGSEYRNNGTNAFGGLCRVDTSHTNYPCHDSMETVWRPKLDIEGLASHPQMEEALFVSTAIDPATRDQCVADTATSDCDVPGPYLLERAFTAEAGVVDTGEPERPIWSATPLDTTGLPSLRGGPVAWGYHNTGNAIQSTLIYTARGSGGYEAELTF